MLRYALEISSSFESTFLFRSEGGMEKQLPIRNTVFVMMRFPCVRTCMGKPRYLSGMPLQERKGMLPHGHGFQDLMSSSLQSYEKQMRLQATGAFVHLVQKEGYISSTYRAGIPSHWPFLTALSLFPTPVSAFPFVVFFLKGRTAASHMTIAGHV